jgi:hypothetical protein
MRVAAFIRSTSFACFLLSCAATFVRAETQTSIATAQERIDLQARYLASVKYASQERTDCEVSKDLTVVTSANRRLRWRTIAGRQQVLCLTWTNLHPARNETIKTEADLWITAIPDLESFCKMQRWEGVDRTLRVEQLLGLPPHFGYRYFVELWAFPEDMLRPSPDPEITDAEAEPRFRTVNRATCISEWYLKWFNDMQQLCYHTLPGFPWTRLGYTYDWGKDDNHVGLSEFVVIKSATIQINATFPTEEYLSTITHIDTPQRNKTETLPR